MLYITYAAIILIADILTKIWALQWLKPLRSVTVLKNILDFTYVENKGIAFGMFSGQRILFIIVTLIVMLLIIGVILKTPGDKRSLFLKFGASFVIGGAAGNLIDRIVYGYVVDFIEIKFFDFPVFNVADIAVCVGAALLVIHYLLVDGKKDISEEKTDE